MSLVVDGLSKRYQIGELQAAYGTLRGAARPLLEGRRHAPRGWRLVHG